MGTKQHRTFCPSCGKTTNHVTCYQKDDGGPLIATVRCAEHSESAALSSSAAIKQISLGR